MTNIIIIIDTAKIRVSINNDVVVFAGMLCPVEYIASQKRELRNNRITIIINRIFSAIRNIFLFVIIAFS